MLFHPFVLAGDLSVRLSLELLHKVRNPDSSGFASDSVYGEEADEDGVIANVPRRISSKGPRNKQKTQSEINSKNICDEI